MPPVEADKDYAAPNPEDFIHEFIQDIVNFLNKRIIKNPSRNQDLEDIAHDFIAHFFSEQLIEKYRPDYNRHRLDKLILELEDLEKQFQIYSRAKNRHSKDQKVLDNLQKKISKKRFRINTCKEKVHRLVKFKTYLFWCLKSYHWWHIVKTVDIYEDADGVIREHIKTTQQPFVVSQIRSEDDYKYGDISNSIFQREEEADFKKVLRKRAARAYLQNFEKYLRKKNEACSTALSLMLAGLDLEDVAETLKQSVDDLIMSLKNYACDFSMRLGNFGDFLEYSWF